MRWRVPHLAFTVDDVQHRTNLVVLQGYLEELERRIIATAQDSLDAEFESGTFRGEVKGATITGGLFRTAESGKRIVIDPDWGFVGAPVILFYSGAAGEVQPGMLYMDPSHVSLSAADLGDGDPPSLHLENGPTGIARFQAGGLEVHGRPDHPNDLAVWAYSDEMGGETAVSTLSLHGRSWGTPQYSGGFHHSHYLQVLPAESEQDLHLMLTRGWYGEDALGSIVGSGYDTLLEFDKDGNAQFGGVVSAPNIVAPIIMRARLAQAKEVPHNVNTTIQFGEVQEDSHGNYDPATGTYTVPEDGLYMVAANVRWAGAHGGSYRQAIVRVDGSGVGQVAKVPPMATQPVFCSLSWTDRYLAGQTLRIDVQHDAGVTLNVDTSTNQSSFRVARIAP